MVAIPFTEPVLIPPLVWVQLQEMPPLTRVVVAVVVGTAETLAHRVKMQTEPVALADRRTSAE